MLADLLLHVWCLILNILLGVQYDAVMMLIELGGDPFLKASRGVSAEGAAKHLNDLELMHIIRTASPRMTDPASPRERAAGCRYRLMEARTSLAQDSLAAVAHVIATPVSSGGQAQMSGFDGT